ncbi:hypothetical protein ABL78_1842 [Leptomonas seymouri]|uniref:Uncharacterized protein n=1 Tax=Leptomonas seymouri TaxID=5684 RepID=A0A0N0P7P5_LEPSE|nr:hypothetical protein ABL78_1842 [Leptomonas seymouri]|eukprot:KPI89029.1 hypothetical protein ABL78_1842 [Leptomonas seymouri]
MPTEAQRSGGAAAAKRSRLEYRRPWIVFYPTAVLFLLLNYLAFWTKTNETGTERLLPDYVASYAASRVYMREAAATGKSPSESVVFNTILFFEEDVMNFFFQLGLRWFRSLFGIQVVCVGAWLIHLFELGMCARICFSCSATLCTTALYVLCTTLAGFAQLVPLISARDAWLAKVKKTGEAPSGTSAQESRKQK